MLKTLAIVQLCRGDRLAHDVTRRLAGKPLLEWVVRRVTDCQRLDGVIVALGNSPRDREIARLVPPDVPVFYGPAEDALSRYVAALREYPAEAVVRVCTENLFIDPVLVDRLVSTADAHRECDYVSYCSKTGKPAILAPLGVFAEWCRADALRRAHRETSDPLDRELVTRYLYSHPEKFQVRLIPVPPEFDRADVRLTIESEEDWDHVQAIFEALGPEALDWQAIAGLLDQHPQLRMRMAAMNRDRAEV